MSWIIYKTSLQNHNAKYALLLEDKCLVEIGLINHNNFIHICTPTQIGCRVGCSHCATTYAMRPFIRSLNYNELNSIVSHFIFIASKQSKPIVLSFSGHGEPLLNWDNVLLVGNKYKDYVDKIFVTTVGVKMKLDDIISSACDFVFYLSLHGSTDMERYKIIPQVEWLANISELTKFAQEYTDKGGRIVFNYMMTNDNTSDSSAKNLVEILNKINKSIELRLTNYIENKSKHIIFAADSSKSKYFYQSLKGSLNNNINVRISVIEGQDIGVACGQMYAEYEHQGV